MGCSLLYIKVVSVQLALFLPYWRMCRRFSLTYHLLPFPITFLYINTAVVCAGAFHFFARRREVVEEREKDQERDESMKAKKNKRERSPQMRAS
jgi:hypothetical protein